MATKREKVRSVSHLRQLINAGRHAYVIVLSGGLVSRKTVRVTRDGKFRIINHIDDSKETLTEAELYTESNIGEAITRGCLVVEVGQAFQNAPQDFNCSVCGKKTN